MKRFFYVLIIFAVVFMFATIHSCNLLYKPPTTLDTLFCSINNFDAELLKTNRIIEYAELQTDTLQNSKIKYDSLVLQLSAWDTRTCYNNNRKNSLFIQTTFAAYPQPYRFSNKKIKSITITCDKDYNENYKANTSLNDIFLIQYRSETPSLNHCKENCWDRFELERIKWKEFYDLNTFLYEAINEVFELNFVIKEEFKPDTIIQDCIFTITYENTAGTIIEKEFNPISIYNNYFNLLSYQNIELEYNSASLSCNMMLNSNGSIYTANHTPVLDLDMALLWQSSYNNCLLSPDNNLIATIFDYNNLSYNLEDKNSTKIERLTNISSLKDVSIDFLNNLIINESTVNTEGGIDNVIEGDFIAFETQEGKKGVIEIKEIYKIQKFLTLDMKVLEYIEKK